eukprot:131873_1
MSSHIKYRLWYLRYAQNAVHKLTFDTETNARHKLKELQNQRTVQLASHWAMSDRSCIVTDWIIMKNFEIIDHFGSDLDKRDSKFKIDIASKKAAIRRKKNKKQRAKKEKEQKFKQEAKRKRARNLGKEICSCGGTMALQTPSSVANLSPSCDQCNIKYLDTSHVWVCEAYGTDHPAVCVQCKQKPRHMEEKHDDTLVKLQDDYNVMTAQFGSLQSEVSRLKANNERLKRENEELKRTMNAQMDKMKELQQTNMAMTQERNVQMDKLKKMEELMNKEEEKKEEDVAVEEKCKVSFKRWLHDVVNLGRYLELFEKNQSDDIRYVEFFDEDTIKNDIGIKHAIHCKFIMKKINEFKKEQMKFNSMLERNDEIRSYKTQFEVNGILTVEQLKREIKAKKDLAKALQMKPNDDNVDVVWSILFSKQKEIPAMIAPKSNEGNITAYI